MNLKGGYIILSLLALSLAVTEEATAITNEDVLKQLLSLSDYALHPERQLKPIYLRAKDSNGVEVVSLCELDRNNGVLRIKAFVMDSVLTIYVAYDIDEETQEVLIDSATYEVISEAQQIKGVIESAESGTISDVLGLDGDGALVKGTISSGTKLYKHNLTISGGSGVTPLPIELVSITSSKITNLNNIVGTPDIKNVGMPIIKDWSSGLYGFILKNAFAGMGNNITYVLFNSDGTITFNTATYTSVSVEDVVTPL